MAVDCCYLVGNLDLGLSWCVTSYSQTCTTEVGAICGDQPLPGGTTGSINITAFASDDPWVGCPGKASVSISYVKKYDCSNDTTHLTFYVTGINTLSTENIKIFPNPTSNELYIKATNKHEKIKYEIIDQQGNIMLNGYFKNDKKLKLNILNKGLYYIKLYVNNGIIIKRLIII